MYAINYVGDCDSAGGYWDYRRLGSYINDQQDPLHTPMHYTPHSRYPQKTKPLNSFISRKSGFGAWGNTTPSRSIPSFSSKRLTSPKLLNPKPD